MTYREWRRDIVRRGEIRSARRWMVAALATVVFAVLLILLAFAVA